MNPYLAGTLLGIVLFLAYLITGTGLGASGGLNRLLVYVQNIVAPEHIDQVAYLLKMAGGNRNRHWRFHLRPVGRPVQDRDQQGASH
jgi:hypothetical protein